MSKKFLLITAIILISLIFILFFITQQSGNVQKLAAKQANICGDGVCSATEDCNSCPQDCGCKNNEYCSSNGICLIERCGDGICSLDENLSNNCCDDCGCSSNQICNKVNHQCQILPIISDKDIDTITVDFLTKTNQSGRIVEIKSTYYKNETLKQVTIDCSVTEIPYPCQITLYIDDSGKIIDVIRTA